MYLEKNMTFLGMSAVEDTLQWQARETVARLKNSGLKVWICTGDKFETTLGVAQQCELINDESKVIPIVTEKEIVIVETLKRTVELIARNDFSLDLLAISGQAHAIIEKDLQIKSLFLQVLTVANSVIFVRMTPSQKA